MSDVADLNPTARTHNQGGLAYLKPRILIVDDDATNIGVLAAALNADYGISVAKDSDSALSILRGDEPPQLLLLDIMMPGLDGISLCRMIKADNSLRHIPVIFITSRTDEQTENAGFQAGAVDYIRKPFTASSVRARVRTHLSLSGRLDHLLELNQMLAGHIQSLRQIPTRHPAMPPTANGELQKDRLFDNLFVSASEGIAIFDQLQQTLAINPAFSRITGYAEEHVRGIPLAELIGVKRAPALWEKIRQSLALSDSWTGELLNTNALGASYPELRTISVVRNRAGEITHYTTVFTDLSHLKETERKLDELTSRDSMTGLSNRPYFIRQVSSALDRDNNLSAIRIAVLVIDINSFHLVNESHGFATGDTIIQQFSSRIVDIFEPAETIARLGSDEFAVMLPFSGKTTDQIANHLIGICGRFQKSIALPFKAEGHPPIHLDPAIGITIANPHQPPSALALLQEAETAHRIAKTEDRLYSFFDTTMSESVRARMELESDLQRAIHNEELELYAQPQFDSSQKLEGIEILLRWRHAERGMIPPDRFIPIAESSKLIVRIGEYVLKKSADVLCWLNQLDPKLTCAVNISAKHFAQPDFVETVSASLADAGVPGHSLIIELTEGLMVHDVTDIIEKMEKIRGLGCQISLDDFGTGYSSLSLLRRLPITEIKIDRSFVLAAPSEPTSASIVDMIDRIGESLGVRVVAEGIENEEHLRFMTSKYPRAHLQGYYFSRPVPITNLRAMLESRSL